MKYPNSCYSKIKNNKLNRELYPDSKIDGEHILILDEEKVAVHEFNEKLKGFFSNYEAAIKNSKPIK